MKTQILVLVGVLLILSCEKRVESKKDIHYIVENYTKGVESKNKNSSIIYVIKDSVTNHKFYRIAKYANLMNINSRIPNHIENIRGNKIVYYTKNKSDKRELDSIKKLLQKNSFYKKDCTYFNSSYPEWVIIENEQSGKQVLVKDMWYRPIDSVIKKVFLKD